MDYPRDIEFNTQTRCIAALYERLFKQYKFKNDICWKICIICGGDPDPRSKKLVKSDVYEVSVPFDTESFLRLADHNKKMTVLQTLQQGIRLVVEEEGWDSDMFEEVYEEVIRLDYQNSYIYGGLKTSPSRKYKAEIFCEHNVHSFDISIIVRDTSGQEVKREKVKSEKPEEWEFVRHLGRLRWISYDEVAVIGKSGKPKWVVKV